MLTEDRAFEILTLLEKTAGLPRELKSLYNASLRAAGGDHGKVVDGLRTMAREAEALGNTAQAQRINATLGRVAAHARGQQAAGMRAGAKRTGIIERGQAARSDSRSTWKRPGPSRFVGGKDPHAIGTDHRSMGMKAGDWFKRNKGMLGNIGLGAGGAAALGGLGYGAKRLMRKAPSNLGRNAGIAALLAGGGLGGYALSKQSSYAALEAWLQPGTCAK